ncbi:M23 family metallopeptidase [Microbacterium betulae]|uniref:M23 family metallopeptidase n=1 Tax=Microbacterium betulae TaxID=2981139 RepID=A0AA97FFR6_9MICO|nr:M23 family metallopeptidase [Microbacterium sp. AB]WOF21574.1 M23 family metallopeptidase [Microbacterium sp. AB]
MPRFARILALLALAACCVSSASTAPSGGTPARGDVARIETAEAWVWPVAQDVRIVRPFDAPPHRYGAGHRGVDLAADAGPLRAPATGVIAFAGVVVDRPLVTIDHGDGLVTTLEPVVTELSPGDAVSRGQEVGALGSGGHAARGAVHFGVRLDGEYVNPLLLLGGVPRAVLLPCCG